MVLEVGPRVGQDAMPPISTGESLGRVLTEMLGEDYEELATQRFIKLYSLPSSETFEFNPRLDIRKNSRIINLHTGVKKGDRVSLDFIFPESFIERSTQIITRNPQEHPRRHYTDVPSIHYLIIGSMGIYTGENFQREEILHDIPERPWPVSTVSGRRPYEIRTMERPALVWTMVPDTAYVSPEQINLPL